jgi:hypothetical protein
MTSLPAPTENGKKGADSNEQNEKKLERPEIIKEIHK